MDGMKVMEKKRFICKNCSPLPTLGIDILKIEINVSNFRRIVPSSIFTVMYATYK